MEENLNPQAPELDQQQYPAPQYPQAKPMMPFWTAVKTCLKKYFDFKGRARRSEYWWFVLFVAIIGFVWSFLCSFLFGIGMGFDSMAANDVPPSFSTVIALSCLSMLPALFFIIPQYAALTRRLHDAGHSGWWVVVTLIAAVIYMIVFFMMMYQLYQTLESGVYTPMSTSLSIISFIFALVFLVLAIVMLVFSIQDSQVGENKYGPSPKYQ